MERDIRKRRVLEYFMSHITVLGEETRVILASFYSLRGQDLANSLSTED